MDLFETARREEQRRAAPLAERMRPQNLDEFLGQGHLVGKGRILRRALDADRLTSLIFYGSPGTGKTTLATLIATQAKAQMAKLSAVTSGLNELRQVLKEATDQLGFYGRRTILFIDEIHRYNKTQQDALLPAVENGTVILIGATTENPFFTLSSPLLSRCRVFQLYSLEPEELVKIIERALQDEERGLGTYRVELEPPVREHLVLMANGDARTALNALELAVLSTPPDEDGVRRINLAVAEESIQRRAIIYDRDGDVHYDVISAFIKSMRGSDPDATIHYLAKMLAAGEDPRFIARRMVICAAEDVGLAEPLALVVAQAAVQAAEQVGMPEARLPLAQAALYLACAPKSNTVIRAIDAAIKDIHDQETGQAPLHLRDAHFRGAAQFGHGQGYLYPHNYPEGYVEQQYLPEALTGRKYFNPVDRGEEGRIADSLDRRRADLHRKKPPGKE